MSVETKCFRVGVDIGGTFTDLIVIDDTTGKFEFGKTLTTPQNPSLAIEKVLVETLSRGNILASNLKQVIHGTTLVTNALIERKGAKTALLTTQGFRDSIEIGRENRYELYDLMLEMPVPLVPRYLRFDVPQRTLADGTTLQELDTVYLERLVRELELYGIEAVAISFLNSFANPTAEKAARKVIEKVAPGIRVSISSEVVPEIREFERTSTTVANVYVQGLVESYLTDLENRLEKLGFKGNLYMMLSSGGIANLATAVKYPIRMLESGPAAGALAAANFGVDCGFSELLSFDMGGTTAKFCVIDRGQPLIAREFEVDRRYRFKKGSGLPIKAPVIEMIEIGAGGGSIARINPLGLLKVGPDSAGSVPGPVCYGRGGTEPTVTDADLVLGYLDPGFFLGGQLELDLVGAARVIEEKIAIPLNLSVEEAAWGIHQVVNESMANAARIHTMERGKDPRQFPVFAFGGAGPVHGYRIARALGAPALIAPLGAGVLSAVGFLTAPLAFDFARTWPVPINGLDWDYANVLLSEMEAQGNKLLASAGVSTKQITHRREADMRYIGQGHEIRVPLPDTALSVNHYDVITASFEDVYSQLYERTAPGVPVEIITWRVVSSGPKPVVNMRLEGASKNSSQNTLKGERLAYFPELRGFHSTPVYDRYALRPGDKYNGPAIVEERESTVIVGPNDGFRVDDRLNLLVELKFLAQES